MRIRIVAPDGSDIVDSASHALPVNVVSQTGGGLTDTQLRASPVPVDGSGVVQPVSGTFWQATQPVSLASLPALTAGAATIGKVDQGAAGAAAWKVDGSGVTQPVSGTFWQATQPVSIASMPSTPVTGTFWQATQPVSAASLPLPSGASTETTLSTLNGKVTACNTGAVTVSAITPPTLTKGTQGSTGFSVQNLRDAGRTLCAFTASAVATVTSEALITLTSYRDLVSGGTATTFAVTAGKKLRLQGVYVTIRCTSTVNVGGIVRFRMLAGTVLVSSPVVASVGGQGSNLATAVAGNSQTYWIDFPEGFELSGTMQFGLTQLFSATTATIDVHVLGYEY